MNIKKVIFSKPVIYACIIFSLIFIPCAAIIIYARIIIGEWILVWF